MEKALVIIVVVLALTALMVDVIIMVKM